MTIEEVQVVSQLLQERILAELKEFEEHTGTHIAISFYQSAANDGITCARWEVTVPEVK